MSDMNARLDGVEQTLTSLTEHVREQFTQIDQRFMQVDQRFEQIDQRFEQIDQRFEQIDQRFEQIDQRFEQIDQRFEQVDQRLAQVDQRFVEVDQRFETLTAEVQKLRILGEENTAQIKVIAEVQAHHGTVLQTLVDAVEPLKVLPDLFRQVAQDHERRITALEEASPKTI
jgi:chromosome segregation ATPase